MTSNTFLARFDQSAALVNPEQQMRFDTCLSEASAFMQKNEDAMAEAAMVAERADCMNNEDGYWPAEGSWESRYKPYKVTNGTLHIPVKGVLIHNFGYTISDWITGYEYITRAIQRGLADGNVRRIALLVDSPGGEVAGCFECADKIFEARGEKPIEGFAHEHAYSAAYAIISATDRIHVSRTGGVGSIGVVTSHTDYSKYMSEFGAKVTFIFAGKHKVDGNAYEALSPEVKQRIQVRIDELYGVFVSTVARHRNIGEDAIRETEAMTFTASESLSNGLADTVAPLDEAMASFEAELSNETENTTMSTEQDSSATDQAAALDAARAEGNAAGMTAGAAAERERISAIMSSDEAQTRPVAAHNVAMKTDMSVEAAASFLAGLNEESPAASTADEGEGEGTPAASAGAGVGANRFENAMEGNSPNLNANSDSDEQGGEEQDTTAGAAGASALLGARAAATGFGRKPKA